MLQNDQPSPAPSGCVFCRIRDRAAAARIVHEDETLIAFLDHRPLQRGHTLIVTKQHYDHLLDVPPEELGPLLTLTQRVARAVEIGLGADGAFVANNIRVGQSVPHVHIHVIPRWWRDGFFGRALLWFRRRYRSESEAQATQDAIADAVRNLV